MAKIHGSASLLVPVALSGRSTRNLRVILGKLESHRRVKSLLHILGRQEIYVCRSWKM